MVKVSDVTYAQNIKAISNKSNKQRVNAHYCIKKAMDYLEMADVYLADMEEEIKTLKEQINGKTS
jgi:hypothetical protein